MAWSGTEAWLPLLLLLLLLSPTADCCQPSRPNPILASLPSLGCRDQDGNLVDWYVINKLPVIHGTGAKFVSDGTAFMHFSSESAGEHWTMSEVPISSPRSPVGRTLAPLYSDPTRYGLVYAFYNDQPPGRLTSPGDDQARGVLAFNGRHGFWLVHSVPAFPPPPQERYWYPMSGEENGQSFLCLTLSPDQLEEVAGSLLYHSCPLLYATRMTYSQMMRYYKIGAMIDRSCAPSSAATTVPFRTEFMGQEFRGFAKNGRFWEDLYSSFVASYLKTNLFAETWRNGPSALPSECSTRFKVQNVKSVKATAAGKTFNYRSSKDNSKWAVSDSEARPWVCIGDMNRVMIRPGRWNCLPPEGRAFCLDVRGGATVCHKNAKLWKVYSQMVGEFEQCP